MRFKKSKKERRREKLAKKALKELLKMPVDKFLYEFTKAAAVLAKALKLFAEALRAQKEADMSDIKMNISKINEIPTINIERNNDISPIPQGSEGAEIIITTSNPALKALKEHCENVLELKALQEQLDLKKYNESRLAERDLSGRMSYCEGCFCQSVSPDGGYYCAALQEEREKYLLCARNVLNEEKCGGGY